MFLSEQNQKHMKSGIHLILPEAQREVLLGFYNEKLQMAQLQVKEFSEIIEQLTKPNSEGHATSSGLQKEEKSHDPEILSPASTYKLNWSWSMKAKFILAEAGKCLTSGDIAEEMKKLETLPQDALTKVSNAVGAKIKEGLMFKRYMADGSLDRFRRPRFFIGLAEWFDDNGNLVDEKYKGEV
jgi:hypothetical protein